jgi:hypothetical protein
MSATRKPKPNYIRQTDKATNYYPSEDKDAYKSRATSAPNFPGLKR